MKHAVPAAGLMAQKKEFVLSLLERGYDPKFKKDMIVLMKSAKSPWVTSVKEDV